MRPAPHPRSGSPACRDQVPLRLLRMSTKRRMTHRRVADARGACYHPGRILLDDQAFFAGVLTILGRQRLRRLQASRDILPPAAAHTLPASELPAGPRRRRRRGQGSTTRVQFSCHVTHLPVALPTHSLRGQKVSTSAIPNSSSSCHRSSPSSTSLACRMGTSRPPAVRRYPTVHSAGS